SYGADLVLSGHVHGGIARLPYIGGVINPGLRLFPKFDSGLFFFREGKSKKVRGTEAKGERLCDGKTRYMVLGRGLGTHTLPIRFLNTAELNVIRLKPKK
nr:phosphoesterase [Lachnospiraceae bacterium]